MGRLSPKNLKELLNRLYLHILSIKDRICIQDSLNGNLGQPMLTIIHCLQKLLVLLDRLVIIITFWISLCHFYFFTKLVDFLAIGFEFYKNQLLECKIVNKWQLQKWI